MKLVSLDRALKELQMAPAKCLVQAP